MSACSRPLGKMMMISLPRVRAVLSATLAAHVRHASGRDARDHVAEGLRGRPDMPRHHRHLATLVVIPPLVTRRSGAETTPGCAGIKPVEDGITWIGHASF